MALKILITEDEETVVTSSGKAAVADVPVTASLTGATLPQTVTAVKGKVSALVRYGKCSQSSTPTPASPVDIICNVGAVREGMFGELLFTQEPTDPDELPPAVPFETMRIIAPNLIPADSFEQGSFSSGQEYDVEPYYSTRVRTKFGIPVKASTQYTVSGATNAGTQTIYVYEFKTNGSYSSAGWKSLPYTFTTSSTTETVRFLLAKASDTNTAIVPSDVEWFQLEEGASATTFKGYASYASVAPLLSNEDGTVKDEQNILTGVITRRMGYLVLTGAETGTWTAFDATKGTYRLEFPTPSNIQDDKVNTYLLCTHFDCVAPATGAAAIPDGGCKAHVSSHYWYFRNSSITSLSAWLDWLQAQYEAGTPVIVVYEKTTAATEMTDYYKMTTQAGSNTIDSTSPADAVIDMTYNNG